jgi:putative transposase
VAIVEPANKEILSVSISRERTMYVVAECFLPGLLEEHGEHPVSTDGETWYPQAFRFPKFKHHIHSSYEKSIMERTVQYIKDRNHNLMSIFHAKKRNAN